MNFRIRNLDTEDKAEYTCCDKLYRQHLRKFSKSANSDLWKFFYWDFFHDGEIESIKINEDLKTIIMRLNCPNIKRYLDNGTYKYVNAMFTCTFRDVSSFNLLHEKTNLKCEPAGCSATYLYAEINTSPLLATIDTDDPDDPGYYSLLIRFLMDNSYAWLEVVSSQVDVVCDEPLTFTMMESDPKFEVPAFCAQKDEPAN